MNVPTVPSRGGSGGAPADGSITVAKLATSVQANLASNVIDVARAYGVVADGSTDNATALMAMRTDLAGSGKPHYVLHFPPGEVRYSDNRWLYNVQSFELVGNNTTLRSIRGGAWDTEWRPLHVGDMFITNVMSSYTPTYLTGHKFNTSVSGAKTLTLTTTAEYTNYAVGDRIFIAGFDKTLTGYPPNATYFEWAKIASINTGTGVITLEAGLRHAYSSDWLDTSPIGTDSWGKARIFNLDRSDYHFPKLAKFSGIVFADGTKNTESPVALTGVVQFPAEELVLDRCVADFAFWVAQNQKAVIHRSTGLNATELDKLVDYVEISDCEFADFIANGTSVNTLKLFRNEFGNYAFISPHILHAEGNHFHDREGTGSLIQGFGGEYIKVATLKDNSFSSANLTASLAHIELGRIYTFTVAGVSGNDILVTASGNNQIAYTLRRGVEIWKADGTKRGKVINVTHNGTQWVISGTWAAPEAAETWAFSSIGELIDQGGNTVLSGNGALFNGAALRWQGNIGGAGLRTTVIREDTLNIVENGGARTMDLYGTLIDITVDVIKPYSGSSDNAHLAIASNTGAGALENMNVNLLVAGRRVLTTAGVSGHQSGDATEVATNLGGFVRTVGINNLQYTTFQKIAVANPQDLPILEILLRWYPR